MSATRFQPRYTIADYLNWKGDWELWEGLPVAMSPSPDRWHQRVCSNLFYDLRRQLETSGCNNCDLYFEIDWHVNRDTVVRPDLLIVCDDKSDSRWIEKTPVFIAEIVSPSRPQNDLVAKRNLYSSEGVRYYLIVDPRAANKASKAQLLRLNRSGTYALADDATIELDDRCKFVLPESVF